MSRILSPVRSIEGERYSFYVASDTFGQPPYRVELDCHAGEGECPCRSFVCDVHMRRREGEDNLSRRLCKHLKKAHVHYARREIRARVGDAGLAQLGASENELIEWAVNDIKKELRRRRKEEHER